MESDIWIQDDMLKVSGSECMGCNEKSLGGYEKTKIIQITVTLHSAFNTPGQHTHFVQHLEFRTLGFMPRDTPVVLGSEGGERF